MVSFYQIHVPKTGGTSLWVYARDNGASPHQYAVAPRAVVTSREPPDRLAFADGSVDWVHNGNRIFSQDSIPKGSIVITALRCPIRQVMSLYTEHQRSATDSRREVQDDPIPAKGSYRWLVLNHSFSDWLRHPNAPMAQIISGKLRHSYVSFFGSGTEDLDGAVTNLKSIDYVFDTAHLTEQFNDTVVAKYGLPHFNKRANTSTHFDISKDDADYIRKHRAADYDICRIFGIEYM